jgi:multiple sugar transport system permease protein
MTSSTLNRPGATSVAPGRAPRRRSQGSGWWPLLFIGPFFVGISAFYLFPILQTVYFSFTKWGAFGGVEFTGLDNWVALFTDPEIPLALANTIAYIAIILLGVPIAVWLASLLNRPGLKFATFYRTMFFLPYLAMPIAIALVWRVLYNGDFGVINSALDLIGIQGPRWLSTPGLAIVSVAIVGLWMSVGFNIIILSAGLKGIPPELYEAASLDGASNRAQFFRITVPLLTPSIFFVAVINVIGGFQLFDLIYGLIGSANPVIAQSKSLVFLYYNESFIENNKGYGAVIAIVILVVVSLVTALQFRLQRRWVNYV